MELEEIDHSGERAHAIGYKSLKSKRRDEDDNDGEVFFFLSRHDFQLSLPPAIFHTKKKINEKNSPESIETVITSVDLDRDGSSVRFGHATVTLHDNQFSPDLVVDLVPLIQHFLDVVLREWKQTKYRIFSSRTEYLKYKFQKGENYKENRVSQFWRWHADVHSWNEQQGRRGHKNAKGRITRRTL